MVGGREETPDSAANAAPAERVDGGRAIHRALPFRSDIEGLRAVAILLVVGYHVGLPGFSGGYVGVDAFFVVSGYLITGLLVREHRSEGQIAIGRFYARRARRLLPAAALVLASTLLVGALLLAPIEVAALGRTARWVALYAGNLSYASRTVEYFGIEPGLDPFLHTWSLAVEEQFYLVWPLLVSVLVTLAARRQVSARLPAVAMFVVAVTSFALCVWLTPTRQPYAFFLAPPRVWEFAVGALASMVPVAWAARRHGPVQAAGVLGMVLLLASAGTFDQTTPFRGAWAALPVVGTALLLVAGAENQRGPLDLLLAARPVQWIGRRSYSWYLWHWPALVFVRVFVPERSVVVDVAVVVGALGVSALAYRFVEQPIRQRPSLVRRPRRALGLGAGLTLGSLLFAVGAVAAGRAGADDPRQQALLAAAEDLPQVIVDGCLIGFERVEPDRPCVYGNRSSDDIVVLFGDSHAAAWFPALDEVARTEGWRLVVMTKASCPTASVEVFLAKHHRGFPECDAWRERSLAEIVRLRPVLTVLANYSIYIPDDGQGVNEQRVTVDEWAEGTRVTSARLDAAGLAHVLLADPPRARSNVPLCLARRAAAPISGFGCTVDRQHGLNESLRTAEAEVLAATAYGRVVDITDELCPGDTCPVEEADGVVRYFDHNHLSATFSARLGPVLAPLLVEATESGAT